MLLEELQGKYTFVWGWLENPYTLISDFEQRVYRIQTRHRRYNNTRKS